MPSHASKPDRKHKLSKRKRPKPPASSSSSHNLSQPRIDKKKTSKKRDLDNVPLPYGAFGVSVSQLYRKICRIGSGVYGVVYKMEDKKHPGSFVALKRCIPHHQASDGFPVTALREIHSLRLLQGHSNIISLHSEMVAVSKNDVFLVFEYCEHDLAKLLDYHYEKQRNPRGGLMYSARSVTRGSPFSEANVKRLLQQLLSALTHIHDYRLIHRDIKLSNLLYTTDGQLKVADFGLSRRLPPLADCDGNGNYNMTQNVVSLWYRPPELLLGSKRYAQKIDVWGCGCVWAELLLGSPLWACKGEKEQINAIFTDLGPPTSSTWPGFVDMPKVQLGKEIASQVEQSSKRGEGRKGKIKPTVSSSMPLLDSFSFLSTPGLVLLTHLLSYDANNQRLSAEQALKSSYFSSEPLPTPLEAMPKFRRAYD